MADSGILLLDKPAGISSAAALAQVKRLLKVKKIGHCGTLDPMATGLLVVLINSATRLADYIQEGLKTYSGTIRLGLVTDSDDIQGATVSVCGRLPEFTEVLEAAGKFRGLIDQIPPQVSAIKVNGQRAYERARRGENSELRARPVNIYDFRLSEGASRAELNFRVSCSRGTYVRSLARDLGEALGCGGCLSSLRREHSAPFDLSEASSISQISLRDLRSWEQALPGALTLCLDEHVLRRLCGGDQRVIAEALEGAGMGQNGSGSSGIAADSLPARRIAIYKEATTGRACGLLVNDGGGWRIGFNVSQSGE